MAILGLRLPRNILICGDTAKSDVSVKYFSKKKMISVRIKIQQSVHFLTSTSTQSFRNKDTI